MKFTIPIPITYKNYIERIKTNRKIQAILLVVLVIAIFITVYAAQKLQETRSRAESDNTNGLRVTNDSGQQLPYEGKNTYTTNSLDIKLKIEDIEKLTQ